MFGVRFDEIVLFSCCCPLGLVYEGFKVMPYSWKVHTPLSNFEAGQNYKDVDDPSVVVWRKINFVVRNVELMLLCRFVPCFRSCAIQ